MEFLGIRASVRQFAIGMSMPTTSKGREFDERKTNRGRLLCRDAGPNAIRKKRDRIHRSVPEDH